MLKLSKYIDHTLLAQDASKEKIERLCNEAKEFEFKSVCVNPFYISTCKNLLKDSPILVCTVIGFPLGQNTIESKVFETKNAISAGADEIDMVINISKLKENDVDYCVNEINMIKEACGDKILKVIVETCLLSDEDKKNAANIILKSNAEFIKTSTGFSTAGANLNDIVLWKNIFNGSNKKIKAAGGIRSQEELIKFINAGADRIGTSSGVNLIKNLDNNSSSY